MIGNFVGALDNSISRLEMLFLVNLAYDIAIKIKEALEEL